VDYTAAGFDPHLFWGLTFRLYDLHMQGGSRRIERDIEMRNRQAYNTAELSGVAFVGKLPKYDKVFRPKLTPGIKQSAQVLEANLRACAIAWGAKVG